MRERFYGGDKFLGGVLPVAAYLVGQKSVGLYAKAQVSLAPFVKRKKPLGRGHVVKGVVQFQSVELRGVVRQKIRALQVRRIKDALPFRVVVAARSD